MNINRNVAASLRCVILASTVSLPAAAHANLVTNGSFELGGFSPNFGGDAELFGAGNVSWPGWTTVGSDVARITTPNAYGLAAEDGNFFLDLTGGSTGAPFGGVSQSIATTVGHEYKVTFYLGSRTDLWGGPPVSINVAFGDGNSFDTTDGNEHDTSTWTFVGTTFFATSTATELTFTGTAGANYIGLDNISVEDLSAVPLPAAAWLLGSAIGGLGLLRRRTSSAA